MQERLDYIDYFRAISMIGIVGGHAFCWGTGAVYLTNWFIYGAAAYYFVFIAGFLFQNNSHKFEIKSFFKKKIIFILIPYLIYTIPVATLYAINHVKDTIYYNLDLIHRIVCANIGVRELIPPVWFVGMLLLFFALSPLLLYIQKKCYPLFLTILAVSLICTILVPRTSIWFMKNIEYTGIRDFLTYHVVFYLKSSVNFFFFYIFGMWWNILTKKHGDFLIRHIEKIAIISFIATLIIYEKYVYFDMYFTEKESLPGIFQTIFCISLLILLEKEIKKHNLIDKFLRVVSEYSYGIFFLHYIVINFLFFHTPYMQTSLAVDIQMGKNNLSSFTTSLLMFIASLFGPLLILWIAKTILTKIFKIKDTRPIIGV